MSLRILHDLIEKHANHVTEPMRDRFRQTPKSVLETATAQDKAFAKKLETKMFGDNGARAYLATQLLDEFRAMTGITLEAATEGPRKTLEQRRAEAESVPAMEPQMARELRDMIGRLSRE